MRKPQAQEAVQLSPGGWSGQPAPLRRNTLRSYHLAARATSARYRSWRGPEDQESYGDGPRARPRALQDTVRRPELLAYSLRPKNSNQPHSCRLLQQERRHGDETQVLRITWRVCRPPGRSRPSPG